VERASRKLGRTLFLAMTRYGAKLEKRQSVLFRLVDVGAELFAMSCACVHAHRLMQQDPSNRGPGRMADLFCRHSRRRVKLLFSQVFDNDDGDVPGRAGGAPGQARVAGPGMRCRRLRRSVTNAAARVRQARQRRTVPRGWRQDSTSRSPARDFPYP
jgi:hypothetical protein